MPPISQEKKDKIAAQILQHLYSVSPEAIFTVSVASEIARDEEFTKTLLEELKRKKLVVEVSKNKEGLDYTKRKRWRLSNEAYEAYHRTQVASPRQAYDEEF